MAENVFRDKRFYKKKRGFMAMRQGLSAEQNGKESISADSVLKEPIEKPIIIDESSIEEKSLVPNNDKTPSFQDVSEDTSKSFISGWDKKRKENEAS